MNNCMNTDNLKIHEIREVITPENYAEFLALLAGLTPPGCFITWDSFKAHLDKIPVYSKIFIAIVDKEMVGSVRLSVTPVFQKTGYCASVEEVVVLKEREGQGIAKRLLEYACTFGREFRDEDGFTIYKITLNCADSPHLVSLYERAEFTRTSEVFMRLDII